MSGKEWDVLDVELVGLLYLSVGDENDIPLTIEGRAIVLLVPTYCCSLGSLSI